MDVLSELFILLQQLREAKVPYALCGGFALSVYGISKPTNDIDILLPAAAIPLLRRTIMPLGYEHEGEIESRQDGQVLISHFYKLGTTEADTITLDVLHVTEPVQSAWDGRKALLSEVGEVKVVSKEGLIELLLFRNGPSDQRVLARLDTLD